MAQANRNAVETDPEFKPLLNPTAARSANGAATAMTVAGSLLIIAAIFGGCATFVFAVGGQYASWIWVIAGLSTAIATGLGIIGLALGNYISYVISRDFHGLNKISV